MVDLWQGGDISVPHQGNIHLSACAIGEAMYGLVELSTSNNKMLGIKSVCLSE